MNCSVLSDPVLLEARQTDVRSLHPEDMMQNDILVRPLVAEQLPNAERCAASV